MNNKPTYKIHGLERRQVKKELSKLKSFVKNYWYFHELEKDMVEFYGGCECYPMSDDDAQKKYDSTKNRIDVLEKQLSELYDQ